MTQRIEHTLVGLAASYALDCHEKTNHLYDGKPYRVHLEMVYSYGLKYIHLLPEGQNRIYALAACFTHDVIEDCRQTYNDVKNATDSNEVAEITYALTNDKGRTRKERAGENYYNGIINTPCAGFVKLCDRLANAKYSKDNGSRMIEVYRKEQSYFYEHLKCVGGLQPMWDELNEILSLKTLPVNNK